MLILGKDQLKDPSLGYARTFVKQVADCLELALEQGVKIVANAGGLNPAGLAEKLTEVAAEAGLQPQDRVGRRRQPRLPGLGARASAVRSRRTPTSAPSGSPVRSRPGADIVVTGRVTDASLVVGPAIWRHGWTPEQYDELAGAVVAGHIIECGTQATGGNFSGFLDLPRDGVPLGFPIAEIAADGSCVITKHAGTGGLVSVDTVTAQLMYEVQAEHYLGPDVTVDLTTIELSDDGDDRVRVSGVRGQAPPAQLKVCVNTLGGFRNQVEFVLTGLDIEAKAEWLRAQLDGRIDAASSTWSMGRIPAPDSETEEGASCLLRCVGQGQLGGDGRQGVHQCGGRAGAGVLPGVHDDGAARAGVPVRRLPSGVRRPRRRRAHRAPARREHRGDRGPAGRRAARVETKADLTVAPQHRGHPRRRDHPRGSARHVRARPLRRQGR